MTTTQTHTTHTENAILTHKLSTANPYERPQKAVYTQLRAKIRDSGLQMYIDLQNNSRADQQTAEEYKTLIALEQAEQTAKHLERTVKNLDKLTKDITATDEQRTQAFKEYHEQSRALAQTQTLITSLTDKLEEHRTFTNRQDLVQVAYLKDLEHRTKPAEICNRHFVSIFGYPMGHTFYTNILQTLTAEQWAKLQSKANFSALCKAVKNYLEEQTTAHTMDKVTLVHKEITEEQYTQWLSTYGEQKVYQPRKRTRESECFATVKYNEKNGKYYKVLHYLTTAPITYIEHYTTTDKDGNEVSTIDKYIKHRATKHEPTAQNISRADESTQALKDFMHEYRHTLTKTQTELLNAFLSEQAEEEEIRAKEEYISTHKKSTTEQAEEHAYNCRLAKAFEIIGKDNQSTRNTIMSRLYEKIRPTKRATAESTKKSQAEPRADLIKWAEQSTQADIIPHIVKWYTKAQAKQSRADEQSRAKEQTAKSTIDNTTATAQECGHLAELRYIIQQATNRATAQGLTAEELRATAKRLEKHRAKADRKSKGKARAEQRAKAEQERAKQKALADLIRLNDIHKAKDQAREELNRQGYNATEYNNRRAIQHFRKSAPLSALVFMGA